MPDTKIDSAVASSLDTVKTDFSVPSEITDAATGSGETRWHNEHWNKWLGYYKNIPELKASIDAKARWIIGGGYLAAPDDTLLLDSIRGWGKDTFNEILRNMLVTAQIGGDAYCEIILDEEGEFLNLKPLDPAMMVHVVNPQGMLIRFEQTSKVAGNKPKRFKPEQIFYFAWNRCADEIHGTSDIAAIEDVTLAYNESLSDYRIVQHRNVFPRRIYILDTDDPSEIANFKAKYDAANESNENIYIPKGTVEVEVDSIPPNSTLDPIRWQDSIKDKFFQVSNTPQIIVGSSKEFSDSGAKIVIFAWKQTCIEKILFVKDNVLSQLNIVIDLDFPVDIQGELMSDKQNEDDVGDVNTPEVEGESAFQGNDLTAEVEGQR